MSERAIKWTMLISGLLTCTMIQAAFFPLTAAIANFGEPLYGPAADIVVRNWGVLITLVGAMLIYGAFTPPVRPLVLTVAGLSKLVFIALVLSEGNRFLSHGAGMAVAIDAVWVVLFAWFLFSRRKSA